MKNLKAIVLLDLPEVSVLDYEQVRKEAMETDAEMFADLFGDGADDYWDKVVLEMRVKGTNILAYTVELFVTWSPFKPEIPLMTLQPLLTDIAVELCEKDDRARKYGTWN